MVLQNRLIFLPPLKELELRQRRGVELNSSTVGMSCLRFCYALAIYPHPFLVYQTADQW